MIEPIDDRVRRRYVVGDPRPRGDRARLRLIFPAADPAVEPQRRRGLARRRGVVHNARNKALFGAWSLDAWNPMFIAPVFTGARIRAFELFGVGVRQARLVSEAGRLAVGPLARLGRRAARRPRWPGSSAGALLATNYVYVMYDRAATMEALDGRVHGGDVVLHVARAGAAALGVARAAPARRWRFSPRRQPPFYVAALGLDGAAARG